MYPDFDAQSADSSATGSRLQNLGVSWIGRLSFRTHAILLGLLLIILIPLAGGHSVTLPDEAVYSAQAQNLTRGSWSTPLASKDIDPKGEFEPLGAETISPSGDVTPYARHAIYPAMLAPLYSLGGRPAMVLLSVVGLWVTAVTTGLIARVLSPRIDILALWIVGLGSPLTFYGFTVTAHALAAACAGVSVLLALHVARRPIVATVGLFASVPLMCLLRSEGTVLGLALGVGLLGMGVGIPRHRSTCFASITAGICVHMSVAGSYLLDLRIFTAITGTTSSRSNPSDLILGADSGPWGAAWTSLLRPFDGDGLNARVPVLLCCFALLLGALALRSSKRGQLLGVTSIGLAAASALTGVVVGVPGFITGLLPAFPVMTAGLAALPGRALRLREVQLMALTILLAGSGLLLTVYRVGGATEWGGRFFQILIPILVPVALFAWSARIESMPSRTSRFVLASLVVISLSMTCLGLSAGKRLRESATHWVSATVSHATTMGSGGRERPLVIVTAFTKSGDSRYFWDSFNSVDVLNVDPSNVVPIMNRARKSRVDQLTLTSPINPDSFAIVFGPTLSRYQWKINPPVDTGTAGWIYPISATG